MRKLFVLTVLIFGVTLLNAQVKSAKEYKIEGADAFKAKDYQKGLTSFERAIKLYEAEGKTDTSLYYNAATCAYKVKEYQKALDFFNQSIDLNYRKCKAFLYKANTFKKLERYEEMEAVCNKGISECPKYQKKYNEILFNYYLKSGLKVYNNAAKMQANAAQLVESDPDKYKTEMVKVKAEFKRSLPMLEKAHKIKPDDETCKNALKQCYKILEMNAKGAGF
ncbi:MAG: tetratricopeptide repeat protein [Bacteroidales bacterium]|nr:tetratricopeptide repeat protein [Bacteroidales bacterium]